MISIKEQLYKELDHISSKDKHGRDLDNQKYEQLYKCIELAEQLEEELTKYKLMQDANYSSVYLETVERPE
jgi:hypothetical protein